MSVLYYFQIKSHSYIPFFARLGAFYYIVDVYCYYEVSYLRISILKDTRMAAEAAKNALDGSMRKGRNLTVRFASIATAIHVSNLGPLVSNEMLEKAFSSFGDVERAVVVVDDRGRSKGYGRVDYARKGNAINALQKTNEGFFMIGRYVETGKSIHSNFGS